MKNTFLFFIMVLTVLLSGCNPPQTVGVKNLQVENQENPEGISIPHPRFTWQIASSKENLIQTSYQIQVSESPEQLNTEQNLIWNSGVIKSDQSVLVPYSGSPLKSKGLYYWRVKVGTNQGESNWSEIQQWSMAFLDSSEWKANWIGEKGLTNPGETDKEKTRLAARYLRKEFSVGQKVKRAVLYISGLGSYETYLNGKRISEDVFAPMPSLYTDRIYYNVYDVTKFIQNKENTLGVIVGNGRFFSMRIPGMKTFGLPSLLAQLEIEHTDGSTTVILSDATWKVTSKGPIVANNEFDGEEYNAALELTGWNTNGYDDSAWKQADLMPNPGGELTAQQNPNIRIQDEVKPISISERSDHKYILDMGQNMVGWLKIDLKGKKDQPIVMRFAETLNPDSTLYVANLRSAEAKDTYIPAKDGSFSWHPSFVYHGFRYVEISGIDYKPELSAFTGQVIYDQMKTTGNFETSNKIINQIHKNAYWGIRGNYRGMPTDCPQRDERLGWLGDRATGAYGEAFVFDNLLLYKKWLQDIEDSQNEEGSISVISPKYWTAYNDDVTWPSAFFYVAHMLYHHFGDMEGITKHYPAMKHWMEHMEEVALKDNLIVKDTYGDWCMPPESQELIHSKDPARKTNGEVLSTTVYYSLLNRMAEFAKLAGKEEDIPHYQELAAKLKEAYNKKFFNEETAQYDNNTVTANILSLRLGLVPEGYESKVFNNIVEKTEKDFGGHVSTGVLGIQHLMRGLTEYGRTDLAYKIATNITYPSWGYMIQKGATTIWELWNGDTADPAMNSGNHVMLLGDLLIWFYEDLAGIKNDPSSVGYKKLLMSPVFPEGLDYVSASYDSMYGKIKSAWKKKNGIFSWDITLPGNTSALVRIPKEFQIDTTKLAGKIKETDSYLELEIGSGTYHFESKK
ncbi:alpha-L-rhamnosidase [Parabacteroides sp. Marseille-P3160]|uniref:alpha-L-rhamnosidase n=1 Tax=Parabacteroides sp. Marseille-P3160 TaxID=1917887 RepID=UPI0009BA7C77|nr:alpha-L-rhamnosidase [Parabacteroides sp. Marseille-P3160]